MASRRQGGRSNRRTFQPEPVGPLEARIVLSQTYIPPLPQQPRVVTHVIKGGHAAYVRDTDFELYEIDVVGGGTVHAEPMSGGRVKLIVNGTTTSSELSINPTIRERRKGIAHTYPGQSKVQDNVLHVGEIDVTSGQIGSILGYRTAELSGAVTIPGTESVSRIAFQSLVPGASITTGGDLDTFDVFNDLTIGGGPGINVGRDLNWLNVGGTVTVNSGSSLAVGRDIGLNAQAAKGTDPGGQGAEILGDLVINPGGSLTVGRSLDAQFIVQGSVTGASLISIPQGGTNFVSRGGFTS